MCYVVYLGTDLKLETSPGSESDSVFHVGEVDESDRHVNKQFSKKNVYYLGSHTGCGCGFHYEAEPLATDKVSLEDYELSKQSVQKLNDLLEKILTQSNEFEIFLCWSGDEGRICQEGIVVSSDFFKNGDWVEDQPTLYKVKQHGTEP